MANELLEVHDTKVVVWDINGRVWHLSGVNAGKEGVRMSKQTGFMFAPVKLLVNEGARQDGATFQRSVRSKKEWDFVVLISSTGKSSANNEVRDFHAVHDAWFRGWSTDQPVTVGFFTHHQGWRFQQAQLDGPPEPVGDVDPATNRAIAYKIAATAMDPLERHFDETDVWTNSLGLNEGSVRARNAADQPCWPRYTMNGPGRWSILDPVQGDLLGAVQARTPRDGEPLRMVQTPTLKVGETLRIDTHPRHRTAVVTSTGNTKGNNVWAQLAGRRWMASLPAWSATDIRVRVDGGTTASSLIVSMTPRSSRPF